MRVMFTGGGTAGHVYPALAVWQALGQLNPQTHARWIGSERTESRLVPAAGLDFQSIDIRFSYRRPTPDNWKYYYRHILPLLLGKPFRQALAALDSFRPQIVFATGGYVSAPVLWAAQSRNVPIALLQIDMVPGAVNWHFAPQAARVYCANSAISEAFAGRTALHKLCIAGYPVMPPQRNRARVLHDLGLTPSSKVLLVMGGSLGSGEVHRLLAGLLTELAAQDGTRYKSLAVVNIGGERSEIMHDTVDSALATAAHVEYRPLEFVDDGISLMLACDFYMGRCGASSTGELIAAGVPALIIPDAQHGDRQQFANAEVLRRRGQALVDGSGSLSGSAICAWLASVWDKPRIAPPAENAARTIAADLMELARA